MAEDILALWLRQARDEQRRLARQAQNHAEVSKTPYWIAKVQAMAEAREEAAAVFERRLAELSREVSDA